MPGGAGTPGRSGGVCGVRAGSRAGGSCVSLCGFFEVVETVCSGVCVYERVCASERERTERHGEKNEKRGARGGGKRGSGVRGVSRGAKGGGLGGTATAANASSEFELRMVPDACRHGPPLPSSPHTTTSTPSSPYPFRLPFSRSMLSKTILLLTSSYRSLQQRFVHKPRKIK